MKTLQRILVAASLLLPLGGFAQTAQSRASLYSELDAQFPTNGAGQITAAILRAVIKDVVASSANPVTDGAYQPLSPLLTAWAAAPSNGLYYRASSTTWSPVTIGSGLTFTSGTLAASGGGGGGMTNPMTAAGDMIIGGTAGAATALPVGTTGKVLTVVSGLPAWATPSGSGSSVQGAVALTDAATIVVDATLFLPGAIGSVTLAGNRTLGNPTGAIEGQNLQFRIRQDATGSRTLALGTSYRFTASVSAISLNTAPNSNTYISVRYCSADGKFDVIGLVQ